MIIDGASISAAVLALDLDIAFQRITWFFRKVCNLVRIYFYAVLPNEKASIRQLLAGIPAGDFAVDLAVMALRIAPRVDHVVLLS